MVEPVTVTAIVGIVFGKAVEKLTEKAIESVLPKINQLRQKIWDKLQGNTQVETEIKKVNQGSTADLEVIADYLKVAMREDQQFAKEVQNLADEINQELEDEGQGRNVMNVYGGKAYQQNQNKGEIYNADNITIHKSP
ncbi:hypothetical protein NIES25_24970 [Nostoc linckia NIES-25]|nr:hypothetical protein NIES25_24970 [Nostoc linckia NIES-25]